MRRFDDANLWSGGYAANGVPRAVLTVRPRFWSVPFSVSIGGHLLSKPGLTFGLGPLYLSWSIL